MRLNTLLALSTSLVTAGCASILDPAPYLPSNDVSSLTAANYSRDSITSFDSYSDGATKMGLLARLYRADADKLRQQKIGFDLFAIGTGIGSVANSVGRGAQTATLALAGTSAVSTGVSSYFGGDTRISAYETGWSALFCAQNVANDLAAVDSSRAVRVNKWLRDAISAAGALARKSPSTKTADGAALAASVISSAQKSLVNLDQAIGVYGSGVSRLQDFTVQTEIATTTKATTGIQNVSATIAAVKAALSPTGSTSNAAKANPQLTRSNPDDELEPKFSTMGVAELTGQLTALSSEADLISKDIIDRMAKLADCVK